MNRLTDFKKLNTTVNIFRRSDHWCVLWDILTHFQKKSDPPIYRSGIFVIDTSVVNCQIFPRHRDDLGVYWKRQKRTCQASPHPANSSAKCARGIQASRCKEFWLKSRTFLPVGAGKNLINRKSLCTLKRGRVYIKACTNFNILQM